MLKQIICDKFREPMLTFKEGLNVVIGDDIASNSIGKSTILMIIDFVFGGNTYIKSNKDAIENLGHHEFKFSFIFNEEEYFFSRNTNEYKYTTICDTNFNAVNKIKTGEYTKFLKDKYKIYIEDISFRDIVGRYTRVYGKENLNERKPMQYFEKETQKDSILQLIKIFDKYKVVKEYEQQINTLTEEKNVLMKAIKNEFIPKITKTVFNQNQKKLMELTNQLEQLKKDIIGISVDIEVLVTKDILELKSEKSQLVKQYNIYDSRLKRTRQYIKNKKLNIDAELIKLGEFFPNVNLDKIREVEDFHNSLTGILKEELKKAELELLKQIRVVSSDIENIDKKIEEKLNIKNAPKYSVETVVNISAQIQQINNENGFYLKKKSIDKDLDLAKNDLLEVREHIVVDICSQINDKMNNINKLIYTDNRRAPTLNINNNDRYVFTTFGDTGTGTAYANLITFDLSLLNLTDLPIVVHDLPLLKNIQNEAIENIIGIYNSYKKQIFIAIDKIHTYNDETAKILEDNKFLYLSKDNTLFILNWKNNN
ncbi:DUF2326 domain-containing protein [Clostridium sporogenes]|uniref:DUF2326 domain-containing protein n=1 Tax=Clostridium sporogenes TaxID=1509 RepID=A0ABD6RRX1_CLOSG|nr:DUF2326 domain-containing protein [Clostridium sporogenes]OSB19166.1 DUF2326 domain-containing protein [Clostridium sporogenes]